jgi:hypothetical protein
MGRIGYAAGNECIGGQKIAEFVMNRGQWNRIPGQQRGADSQRQEQQ